MGQLNREVARTCRFPGAQMRGISTPRKKTCPWGPRHRGHPTQKRIWCRTGADGLQFDLQAEFPSGGTMIAGREKGERRASPLLSPAVCENFIAMPVSGATSQTVALT